MARSHGFVSTYTRGCRCRPCTDAKARAQQRYRARHPGRSYLIDRASDLRRKERHDHTQD